jgi:hypothetical protein
MFMTKINKQSKENSMPAVDFRARLQPKSIINAVDILGPRDNTNILFPLYRTNGVLFPYTPTVSTGATAEYDQMPFVHSNYSYNSYIRSFPKPISISAEFTAQSNDEALYLLAVIHFFRSVTKSYFGITPYNKAGTPPPTLLFNYLGQYQFNNVPVIVKSFDYSYEATVDYVPVSTTTPQIYSAGLGVNLPGSTGFTYVPTHIKVTVELDTQYIPIKIRNEFNLDKFRQGKLMDKGYI